MNSTLIEPEIIYETKYKTTSQWTGLIPVGPSLNSWQIETIINIVRLMSLPSNWDSYGSPSLSRKVAEASINLLKSIEFDDLATPYVIPVSGGGIQFEWSVGQRELEIEILPDGSIEYLKIEGEEHLEEGKLAHVTSSQVRYQVQSLLKWIVS